MQLEDAQVSPALPLAVPLPNKLSLWQRCEILVLTLVPVVHGLWVFAAGTGFDPDSYYHIGVAEMYATRGWLSNFPWLKFTPLGESFSNVYLGQHLLLAPLTRLFEPLIALKIGVMLLSSALVLSIYAVLKRWQIPHPALWALGGAFASPLFITINCSLKGGSLFFILFVWFLDAVWSRSARRSFILAWLSVYVYVGAAILVPALLVFVLMRRFNDGVWEAKLSWAVLGGLLAGYVVNPFWPDHWIYTARELRNFFSLPAGVVAGEFYGGEWRPLSGNYLVRWAALYLALWFVLLIRQLRRSSPVGTPAAAGTVLALGLLGASFPAVKFLQLFFIASSLFLPRLACAMRPWPRQSVPALALAASVAVAFSLYSSYRAIHFHPNRVDAQEYRQMAEHLNELTAPRQVVVAPWDDFPGLFLYNRRNTYVAGHSPLFLRWASEKRFKAFMYLYQGKVRDPEKLLPMFFEDAEIILVRTRPRNRGEERLNEQLKRSAHFEELLSVAPSWRIFRLKKDAPHAPTRPSDS